MEELLKRKQKRIQAKICCLYAISIDIVFISIGVCPTPYVCNPVRDGESISYRIRYLRQEGSSGTKRDQRLPD